VDSLATIFWINGLSALGAAALIFAMVPWIRGVMSEHDGRAVPPPPAPPGPAARPVPEPAHPGR
jgi:hypothetical protein